MAHFANWEEALDFADGITADDADLYNLEAVASALTEEADDGSGYNLEEEYNVFAGNEREERENELAIYDMLTDSPDLFKGYNLILVSMKVIDDPGSEGEFDKAVRLSYELVREDQEPDGYPELTVTMPLHDDLDAGIAGIAEVDEAIDMEALTGALRDGFYRTYGQRDPFVMAGDNVKAAWAVDDADTVANVSVELSLCRRWW